MKKIIKPTLIILLVLIIATLGKNVYFAGSQAERDQILEATVWQLSQEGYTKIDFLKDKSDIKVPSKIKEALCMNSE